MIKRIAKITLAIALGGIFLWLAFRNVRLEEVWSYAQRIDFGWVLPFAIVALTSHVVRAERWRLLIKHDKEEVDRITLITGVLVGYLLNFVGPRLGEVSRPAYVARRESLSASKLMGTIVLERIIDVITMVTIMFIVSVYLISDISLLSQIFGDETVDFFTNSSSLATYLWVGSFALFTIITTYLLIRLVRYLGNHIELLGTWVDKAEHALHLFKDGLLSARKVKQWWLFILYTVLMWTCYTLMTYIPFWMFDMQTAYNLNMLDALVITVISAIGIAIPSPGGIGTYHYFVKQSLFVLFAVPAVTGIAYATVTHAAMILFVCCMTPIALFVDKLRATRAGKPII